MSTLDFVHVEPLLEQRAEMGQGKRPLDYGMAEALAFAEKSAKDGDPVFVVGHPGGSATRLTAYTRAPAAGLSVTSYTAPAPVDPL